MKPTLIRLMRGDDESRLIKLKERQPNGTIEPLNLANFSRFDLHAISDDNQERVLTLSSETGEIAVQNAENGELLLTIAHGLTETSEWQQASYDLQATDNQGQIRTLMRGRFSLIADITRIAQ